MAGLSAGPIPSQLQYTIFPPASGTGAKEYGTAFGQSVAMDGAHVVVGEPGASKVFRGSGVAAVFEAQTGALLHVLVNPEPGYDSGFGFKVAVSALDQLVSIAGADLQFRNLKHQPATVQFSGPVVWHQDLWVAAGNMGSALRLILTSPDGEQWTPRFTGSATTLVLASNGSEIIAVGGREIVFRSTDGLTWSPPPVPRMSMDETSGTLQWDRFSNYESYTVESSSDLTTWVPAGPAAVQAESLTLLQSQFGPRSFFRVNEK